MIGAYSRVLGYSLASSLPGLKVQVLACLREYTHDCTGSGFELREHISCYVSEKLNEDLSKVRKAIIASRWTSNCGELFTSSFAAASPPR
jgi:hypothetical protein